MSALGWVILTLAFALGSLPFGLWWGRFFAGADIRSVGSGNVGATNVARVAGVWPAGVITLACDGVKGALAAWLAAPEGVAIWSRTLGLQALAPQVNALGWIAGFIAVLGHCYTPWLQGKGGKGVATALGVVLVLDPVIAGIATLAFVIALMARGIVSIASLWALLAAVIWSWSAPSTSASPVADALVLSVMAFVVLLRHEKNIDALLEGTERPYLESSKTARGSASAPAIQPDSVASGAGGA